MAEMAGLAEKRLSSTERLRGLDDPYGIGGVIPFLLAGIALFASLVIGSAASMLVAGSNRLIGAILEGFLSLGLWALAAFAASFVAVFAATALQRHRLLR